MMTIHFIISGLLLVLGTLSMGFAVSNAMNKTLRVNNNLRYEAIPILGVVSYAAYIFLTGYFIGLNSLILALPVLLILKYTNEIRTFLVKIGSLLLRFFSQKQLFLYYLCVITIVVFAFLRLFGARIDTDSLVYHLYLPKLYISAGHIFRVPFSEHALWPQLVEMFATLGMVFDGVAAAKLFSFLLYLCIGGFCFLLMEKFIKSPALTVIGAILIMATPAYFFYAADTYVDLAVMLFTLATVYFLIRYRESARPMDLIIAAVSCAGALSCKYTAIFTLTSALVILASMGIRKRTIRDIFIFVLASILLSSYWYIWAYSESGNPVFPFGCERFAPSPTSPLPGAGTDFLGFITLPFNMIFRPALFGGAKIGLVYLLAAPFFLCSFFIKGNHRILLVFIVLYLAQWFLTRQYLRYIFPVLALYMITALAVIDKIWKIKMAKIAFFTVITPLLLFQTAWSGYYLYQDFEYLAKGAPREDYLDPSYKLGKFLNENIVPDKKILLIGEDNLFYLPNGAIREKAFRNFTGYDLKKDKLEFLKNQGIRYVLINKIAEDEKRSTFNAKEYFLSEIKKGLKALTVYNNAGRNYILCEITG